MIFPLEVAVMSIKEIFVVYDPTRETQPALNRAVDAATETNASIRLFACIYTELPKPGRHEEIKKRIAQQNQQLEVLVAPLREKNITVQTEVEWEKDWYHAVVRAVFRHGSDVLFKATYRHSLTQRFLSKSSDWTLIRECPCPVLLVRENANWQSRKVLAAIDIRADDEDYQRLNSNIVAFSKTHFHPGSEVHFINAYSDSLAFPDRNKLMQFCDTESSFIHIELGAPEEVIPERARALQASAVVIGSSGRTGFSAFLNGNTAEKILDELDCDLQLIP